MQANGATDRAISRAEESDAELEITVEEGGPPPERVGRYEILERLNAGGMAEIYLARVADVPDFEHVVVIKRIQAQLAGRAEFVDMFLDEARITALLSHPNIVQIHDVGRADGGYYIAMEYLDGEDLGRIAAAQLRGGRRLPLPVALHIVASVCAGLHSAHERTDASGTPLQIVHRDISPQNIFVTYAGAVKLIDFGLVKAEKRLTHTRTGILKGKLHYMSPEQVVGEVLDRRSDVFSTAIVLWELTVGRRLFDGDNDYEVLRQVVEGRIPPPRSIVPEYPEELERIVMRALEKDRAKRYATAHELQIAIEEFMRRRQLQVLPSELPAFMRGLFGAREEWWRRGRVSTPSAVRTGEHRRRGQRRRLLTRFVPALVAASLLVGGGGALLLRHHQRATARRAAVVASGPIATPPIVASESTPGPASVARDPSAAPPIVGSSTTAPAAAPTTAAAGAPSLPELARAIAIPPVVSPPVAAAPAPRPAAPAPTSAPARAPRPPQRAPNRPARAVATGTGTLVIETTPWSAVAVDDTPRGETPVVLTLPAGTHKVVLDNPEFHLHRVLRVRIEPGATLRKKLDFGE